MKVNLWQSYKDYKEVVGLEYGKLSNTIVQENKEKWDKAADVSEAVGADGVLTPIEKRQTKKDWDSLDANHKSAKAQADFYWKVGTTQPIEKENCFTRHEELRTYLFVTVDPNNNMPILSPTNMEKNSNILRSEYDTKFQDYYVAYSELTKIIANKAKELADEAQDRIDGVEDNIVYTVYIDSTEGNIFKNGNIQTTLIARLSHGKNDITAETPAAYFRWYRISEDKPGDEIWNQNKGIGVKQITVTNEDVFIKATFKCDIDLENL